MKNFSTFLTHCLLAVLCTGQVLPADQPLIPSSSDTQSERMIAQTSSSQQSLKNKRARRKKILLIALSIAATAGLTVSGGIVGIRARRAWNNHPDRPWNKYYREMKAVEGADRNTLSLEDQKKYDAIWALRRDLSISDQKDRDVYKQGLYALLLQKKLKYPLREGSQITLKDKDDQEHGLRNLLLSSDVSSIEKRVERTLPEHLETEAKIAETQVDITLQEKAVRRMLLSQASINPGDQETYQKMLTIQQKVLSNLKKKLAELRAMDAQ